VEAPRNSSIAGLIGVRGQSSEIVVDQCWTVGFRSRDGILDEPLSRGRVSVVVVTVYRDRLVAISWASESRSPYDGLRGIIER